MTIEAYVRALRRALGTRGVAGGDLAREVAEHLRDSRDEEIAHGISRARAEANAIRRFGSVEALADRLAAQSPQTAGSRSHQIPISAERRGANDRPRLPGLVYGALSLALLILVATLTLTARQPPPPTIAEFAPQAVEQITQPPPDQTSTSGLGKGVCRPGDRCVEQEGEQDGAGMAPRSTILPRVRRCVGDPPRQIEDPQSPPCVPSWSGDNGGATWRGVTRDTITVAIPAILRDNAGSIPAFLSFFNTRFEFYGRKLVVKFYNDPTASGASQARMEADAIVVRDEIGAFADLGYALWQGGQDSNFYDALARYSIISVQNNTSGSPKVFESHLTQHAPYQWNYAHTPDRIQQNLVEVVCKQLAGVRPNHAGPGFELSTKRKFGLIRRQRSDGLTPMDDSIYVAGVRACSGAEVVTAAFDGSAQSARSAMVRLAASGVTTAACWCQDNEIGVTIFPAASSQGYYPEWLITHYGGSDDDQWSYPVLPREQAAHAMGLRSMNKMLKLCDEPYTWTGSSGCGDLTKNRYNIHDYVAYSNFLLFASGVQLAGPVLTPKTFEQGLFKARFPNPGANGPPYYQSSVSFGPGKHTMQDTFAAIWWSNTEKPNDAAAWYSQGGTWCYVDQGTRHGLGTWPTEDRFFTGTCR